MTTDETPAIQRLLQSGLSFHRQGNLAEAAKFYEAVLAIKHDHFDALHFLGVIAAQNRAYEKAVARISQAIAVNPGFGVAYSNLGLAQQGLGRVEEALASYGKAIELAPGYADAYANRGAILVGLKRFEEALADHDRVIGLTPDNAGAYLKRGDCLQALKRFEEAVADYGNVLTLNPGHAEAWLNRGMALQGLGRFQEALASYDQAVALDPVSADAHAGRGNDLQELKRFDEALASYDRAIALDPDSAESWLNRAIALRELKRFDEALAGYDKAIVLKPDYAEAHFHRAYFELLSGQMESGWRDYEWRKKMAMPRGERNFSRPLLASLDDARGKSVLVHWEQGLGDTIQFCRYVPMLQEAGARVLFAPQKQLIALLSSLQGPLDLVALDDPSLSFDYHLPLMSLPLLFQTGLETVPAQVPYLFADRDQIQKWRTRIGGRGFKIGVCWKGSSTYKDDADRSFSAARFDGLSRLGGVRLISLQKGEGEDQLKALPAGMVIESFGADFDSGPDAFVDTAAIMKGLDLVITSDTAVAHLAGALGVPAWVALQYVPEWRWMLNRDDSPWYLTMRLFRQRTRGDWSQVFRDMEAALVEQMGAASGD